jgi:hypothetical protein
MAADANRKNHGENTLIIPAGGSSKRYPNMRPKWMLTHPHGKLMIEEVVDGLQLEYFDECHIVVLKEHCEKYDADVVIKQIFGDRFKITVLDEQTSCSPETVVKCIVDNSIHGYVVVKDCDCLVEYDCSMKGHYVVGLDIHKQSIPNLASKSFITLDSNEFIDSITEKKVVSEVACLGVYSIDADVLIRSYNEICDVVDPTRANEIYFSNIVSRAIQNGVRFDYVECDKYIDWGTAKEWFEYTAGLKTYIFDIDGVMLHNVGKYGNKNWSNTFEPIHSNIELVRRLSRDGAEIIFITSRTEEYLAEFKSYMNVMGIQYKTIISGCNHNRRILINDHSPTNPYPSCDAVSVPRNSDLTEFIS